MRLGDNRSIKVERIQSLRSDIALNVGLPVERIAKIQARGASSKTTSDLSVIACHPECRGQCTFIDAKR